jgi:hypothetical protein
MVSASVKLTRREAELLDILMKEYGFVSKSEAIGSIVHLSLNLLELGLDSTTGVGAGPPL